MWKLEYTYESGIFNSTKFAKIAICKAETKMDIKHAFEWIVAHFTSI
jgi:hypothetical protein